MFKSSPHPRRPTSHASWTDRTRCLFVATLVVLGVGALTACGSDDLQAAAPVATVHMGEYFYQPAEVTVPRDSTVNIVNDGALVHSWVLKEAGVGTAGIAPGKSILVGLRGVAPGTYTIYCDQAGHTQAGQIGTLTIAP